MQVAVASVKSLSQGWESQRRPPRPVPRPETGALAPRRSVLLEAQPERAELKRRGARRLGTRGCNQSLTQLVVRDRPLAARAADEPRREQLGARVRRDAARAEDVAAPEHRRLIEALETDGARRRGVWKRPQRRRIVGQRNGQKRVSCRGAAEAKLQQQLDLLFATAVHSCALGLPERYPCAALTRVPRGGPHERD